MPREHPEGGTYYIRVLTPEKQVELEELLAEREFVFSEKGELLFDQKGFPISKSKGNALRLLRFIASEVIERIEGIDFVDDDGNTIDFSDDEIRLQTYEALLAESFEEEYMAAGVDNERHLAKRRRQTYFWVMEEAGKLRKATREVELKNS